MGDEATQTSTWLLDELVKDLREEENEKEEQEKKELDINWSGLAFSKRLARVLDVLGRLTLLLAMLYGFVCSLGLLEDAFKMLGGRAAGEAFSNNALLASPITGLMIGVLATVLLQSSSTATAIVVAMVSSEVIPVRSAIPIIMGTNVGTSVTSTLVSMAQAGQRDEFRRAFAGATVHDMFNWSAVLLLLPLERLTGYLETLTSHLVVAMVGETKDLKMEMLKALTKPFTELIVEVNKGVITELALIPGTSEAATVMRRWCSIHVVEEEVSVMRYQSINVDCSLVSRGDPFFTLCSQKDIDMQKMLNAKFFIGWNESEIINKTITRTRCPHLMAQTDLSDKAAGAIVLVVSLIIMMAALVGIVKVLHALLQGPVAKVIRKTVNADFPGRLSWLTGYVAVLVGCALTILVQSSSVFTSTLTPLVGVGMVSVERMYPMTLGSNVGTCVTGILAALSTKSGDIQAALQIALCHLFFNITALAVFYPLPFMRFPIKLAKVLGRVTSKHRWFAGFYLVLMFIIIPGCVFGLSYAGEIYLFSIGGPLFFLFLVIVAINILQRKRPTVLPRVLRSWDFLPRVLHSLSEVERLVTCRCFDKAGPCDDGNPGSSLELAPTEV